MCTFRHYRVYRVNCSLVAVVVDSVVTYLHYTGNKWCHPLQILRLYRDPHGKLIFTTTKRPVTSIPLPTDVEGVAPLRKRIADLEEELNVMVCV